jgi:UDP-N-acetylmuramate dehydrogenase
MKIINNCDLTLFNSYRIPAKCRIAYFPESATDIVELFQSDLSGNRYIVVGSGHNVILASEHYETPFIIFNGNMSHIEVSGETMTLGAGAFTKEVCEMALVHALSGFEMFYDIPSSIGGAIVMNAGAKDEDIAGILETVTYLDVRGQQPSATSAPLREISKQSPPSPNQEPRTMNHEPITITNQQADFRYRNSIFQDDPTKIILCATFRLRKGDPSRIRKKMEENKAERWAKQPREYPNAGSVFKRPPGRFVGPMLDELGLKGHTHSGFRVSPKHSGFIEKIGTGTCADLLALIKDIQSRVRDRFQVELEIEQRIIDAA